MYRLTEKCECKQPEYPAFLEGTYFYRYIGDKKEPKFIIGELIHMLGKLEDKLAENKLIPTEYTIGQKVYFIKNDYIISGNIIDISIDVTKDGVRKIYTIEQNSGWQTDRLEEDIFLTYEKAEEKLEELREKEDE